LAENGSIKNARARVPFSREAAGRSARESSLNEPMAHWDTKGSADKRNMDDTARC
jgi:hypothetical protein